MTTVITPTSGPIVLPFTDIQLTNAINQLPTPFGQLTAEGMFPAEPLASQYVEIDVENGVVSALPVTNDGPATIARHGTRDARIFRVPTVEHFDNISAKDILSWQNIAARSRQPETLVDLVNVRLQRFKLKFNLTWELMRMTSLKGVITDGKGTQVYDLFAAFELTKKIVYFDLSNAAADIQGACDLIYGLITEDLNGEVMTRVEARVSTQFFNKLIQHAKVEKFWLNAEQASGLINIARGVDGGYRPRSFDFGGIHFIEYPAIVPMWGGTSTRIITQGKGHAYPAGTVDSHVSYVAPPDDIRVLDGSDVNVTDAIHLTTEVLDHGKGQELLGRMNVLPLWRRPALLVELDDGSGSSTATRA